ncbi:MAG: 4'-phosphopantetheinyl transferase superfamily protein [Pseudomonadota bacterium]
MKKLLTCYLSDKIVLSTDRIDCYMIDLNLFDETLANKLLSEDELARAAKLKPINKRRQFTISRALLRELIASCLMNISAKDIVFQYGQHGKPMVNYAQSDKKIKFNLSHTDHYTMIVLTLTHHIGVDIEAINPRTDQAALVKRFFSESELNAWQALPDAERTEAFFRCWTRKEAFIKAEGSGVSFGLDKFIVSLKKVTSSTAIEVKEGVNKGDWTNYSSISINGYASAIACNHDNLHISNHVITN